MKGMPAAAGSLKTEMGIGEFDARENVKIFPKQTFFPGECPK